MNLRVGWGLKFDIFFSICRTPVNGFTPSEKEMFSNFSKQVIAADKQGYDVAWIAESHLSSESQKRHLNPVIPNWHGEVGLQTDIVQTALALTPYTQRIQFGSAISNLLWHGPFQAAEKISSYSTFAEVQSQLRPIHYGFAAGRFDYMNRAVQISPRDELETFAWSEIRTQAFEEASHIFLRLLKGDEFSSEQILHPKLEKKKQRSPEKWPQLLLLAKKSGYTFDDETIVLKKFWNFESQRLVPQEFSRNHFSLYLGSHDPILQTTLNEILPVRVFNLSITPPNILEQTHQRMKNSFNSEGGPWMRSYLPRTSFVFINEQSHLSKDEKRAAAYAEAQTALTEYWKAMEGTVDPKKVAEATDNALVGTAEDIISQIKTRFHPEDRLMLWFDFFNHNCERVIENQAAFQELVATHFQKN